MVSRSAEVWRTASLETVGLLLRGDPRLILDLILGVPWRPGRSCQVGLVSAQSCRPLYPWPATATRRRASRRVCGGRGVEEPIVGF